MDIADGEHISAGTAILAAGVWTAALAETAALEVPVQAQREQILLVRTGSSHGGGAPASPI